MITHLLYANDTLLFVDEKISSIIGILALPDEYCRSSGHRLNARKSIFLLDKDAGIEKINSIRGGIGFSYKPMPFIYLGVPIF